MFELLQGGLTAFTAYSGAAVNRQLTNISNRVDAANVNAKNTERRGQNALGAAVSSNSRFVQSVNNNRQLKAAGSAIEATYVNSLRQQDDLVAQGFEAAIGAAEQLGMAAASGAAAGAGGSVTDAVNVATALRSARAAQASDDNLDTFKYDTQRRAMSLMSQAVDGLDITNQFTNLDYGVNVAQPQRSPSPWATAITSVLAGGNLKGMASDVNNIVSSFSTPAGNGFKPKTAGTGFQTEKLAADPFSSNLNFSLGSL